MQQLCWWLIIGACAGLVLLVSLPPLADTIWALWQRARRVTGQTWLIAIAVAFLAGACLYLNHLANVNDDSARAWRALAIKAINHTHK